MLGKKVFILSLCLVMTALSALASSPKEGYDQARREVLSAWLSMAAYDDKPGEAARQELTRRGWDIDNRIQKDNK